MFNWNVQANPIQSRLRAQVESLFPQDEHANDLVHRDLVHRQTVLLTRDADAAARQLYAGNVIFVSSGVVANQNAQLGFTKAFLVVTPTGMLSKLNKSRSRT
jgi:hypothetical protein